VRVEGNRLISDEIYVKINLFYYKNGGMLEWTNRPVLKTGVPQGTGGSNPPPTALRRAPLAKCRRDKSKLGDDEELIKNKIVIISHYLFNGRRC
jgi:hypothetical protein